MSHLVRVYRAVTRPGQEEAFRAFLVDEAVPILRRYDGLVSIRIGRPAETSPSDFLMTTVWTSIESLKEFAGETWEKAVVDPREEPLLQEVHVNHYWEIPV